jgi:subtilisin-like proprotein convertase family protein
MFLKKYTKNLRSILTVLTLFGLGLTGFFWAADSSAQSGESTARLVNGQARIPEAIFPGTGVGPIADTTTTGTFGPPRVVSFAVTGVTGAISDVSVDLTATHTFVGDLDVVLAAPGGSPSIVVFSRVGAVTDTSFGDSSDLGGTYLFTDSATANFWAAATTAGATVPVAPGSYRTTAPGGAGQTNPAPATNLTAAFSGLTAAQANGTWTLTFRDRGAGDTGAVSAANLSILTGGATPTPTATPTATPTPTVTPTPIPGALQDGGFELNTGTTTITNPFWTSTSTAFTTSLCTVAACGTGAGAAAPRTGNGWVWFDGAGSGTAAENGTVQQTAIIPVGTTTLSYYLRIGSVTAPSTSVLRVSIDGTVLQTINEPATAETAYTQRTVNISAFANGASHTILFSYARPAGTTGSDNFTIDDVSLIAGGATPTPTPTPTVTPTPTPTVTPTPTPTPTVTPTPSASPTGGFGVLAVTTTNQLIRFNSNNVATPIGSPIAITGLQAGENILGIDIRPATGQLYGLGSTSRLYTINTMTGAATAVGAAGAFTLSGTNFGFDFNPTVDRIRVVSDTGQNLRLNPIDGTATIDPVLNGAATGADAAAYTNSFGGSTTTTLYDISSTTDTLYIQNPANAGTLVTVGALGFNVTGINGFDIANSGNIGLAAFQLNGGTASGLYTVNLTTGAAAFAGAFSPATLIRGIAITSGSAATNVLDVNGDRRADFIVSRTVNGVNSIFFSRPDGSAGNVNFGFPSDIFTPGDYDGDGRTDIAVWRPTNGTFYVLRSSDNATVSFAFGQNGDEPVARDYDGDGRTDYAVVRRAGGVMTWYIRNSSNGTFTARQFGASSDVTAPGDYDGDGRFDLAVFRGAGDQAATFFVLGSTSGFRAQQFGLGSDLVVPGDYDGDGRTDFAVVRTGSAYDWYILRSSNNTVQYTRLGTKPHLTVQNDYDGDGRTDVAVWDPIAGVFYIVQSSNGATVFNRFGQNGDYPVANYDTH